MSIDFDILSPESHSEWDAFVDSHPDSTCYHLSAWKQVSERAYRVEAPYLLARSQRTQRIVGGLPLFTIDGWVRRHHTNGLFGAYASPLANQKTTYRALLEEACRRFQGTRASHLILKCIDAPGEPFLEQGFKRLDNWVIATLQLDRDPDVSWNRLEKKTRNCVRKAMKNGLEIRVGQEELPAFYEVLAENMHAKGAPIYGLEFMRILIEALGDRAEILTVWKEDRAIAGALLISHRKRVTVPFASSRPDSLSMSPNHLLYWEIIRRSAARGMEVLDFGRSLRNSGPLRFKRSWGSEVLPQPCYLLSSSRRELELDPKDPWISFFVRQWQRLPRRMVNALGPSICRQVAGLL